MLHDPYIRRTLTLARRAIGRTKTNPMVGALLVNTSDGAIVAEGYHKGYGLPHAEIDVIEKAKRKGIADLSKLRLYVNLEPCCHFGKTPPCTDRIIQERIGNVIFGTLDPFAQVSGKGLRRLRKAGVHVEYGFLEDECRNLNRVFFKQVSTGLPWVTLKLAQTLDGYIATQSGDSKWISGVAARNEVQRMRAEHDAILVGIGTVLADNPALSVRNRSGRNPIRVVLDSNLRIPETAVLVTDGMAPTIIISKSGARPRKKSRLKQKGVHIEEVRSMKNLPDILRSLRERYQVGSLLVEGGSSVSGVLLAAKLVDELILFVAPKVLGDGLPSFGRIKARRMDDALPLDIRSVRRIGNDLMMVAVPVQHGKQLNRD